MSGRRRSREGAAFRSRQTVSGRHPSAIIDGQHRVFGAREVSDFDVVLPVVLLPGLPYEEQVFHFYVLNNKARPLRPTELRATISTSLTNKEIGDLYRYRWKIETFFKWMKQHLKLKTFYGKSENAVYTQIWIALITYCLKVLLQLEFRHEGPLLELTRSLSKSTF